ncbi:MAG: response regulator [Candidatus Coatesbacteria bacterium]|nr:MAG: response regulator [Candidatus Coatesbacteria bacterium]
MKEAYGPYEIAEMLGVAPSSVGTWIDKGFLEAFKTPGGHRRIYREDLVRFLNQQNIPVPNEVKGDLVRILIIEDEIEVSEMIERALSNYEGIEIYSVNDGIAALLEIGRRPPDMVILDIVIPGIDGFEVCKRITRDKILKTKILTMSGKIEPDDVSKLLESGANRFLRKPFSVEDLTRTVDDLLVEIKESFVDLA